MEKDSFEAEIKKALQATPDLPAKAAGISPPLFIKMERYNELLESVQKLRSYALGLRDALDALAEVSKEFKAGMDIANKSLDKINILMSSIDMKLMGTSRAGPGGQVTPVKPPVEVEMHVKGIYEQIERLKSELKAIS